MSPKKIILLECLIFAISILVSCGVFFYVADLSRTPNGHTSPVYSSFVVIEGDSTTYAENADRLIENHYYGKVTETGRSFETLHPIGYPFIIAIFRYLTGSFYPVIFFQIFLSACAAVLIFRITRRFVPAPLSIIPAIIFATDPSIAYYNTIIFSDGIFASLFFMLVYLLFFRENGARNNLTYLLSGIFLGVNILIRPIAQFLSVLFPLLLAGYTYVLYYYPTKISTISAKKIATLSILLFFGCMLVLLPWIGYKGSETGRYDITDLPKFNLLWYNVQYFLTYKEIKAETGMRIPSRLLQSTYPAEDARIKNHLESEFAELRSKTPKEISDMDLYFKLAFGYISKNPFEYGAFHIINTAPIFLGRSYKHFSDLLRSYEPLDQKKTSSAIPTNSPNSHNSLSPEIVYRIILTILSGASVISIFFSPSSHFSQSKNQRITMLICWFLILYFTILTGPLASFRYRIVVEPYILITATLGFTFVLKFATKLFFPSNNIQMSSNGISTREITKK